MLQTCLDFVVCSCLTILNITAGATKWCQHNNSYILQPAGITHIHSSKDGGARAATKKKRGCFAFTFRVLHKPHAYQPDWRCRGKVIGIITPRGRLPFIRAHSGISAKQLLFKLRMLGGLERTELSAAAAAAAHVQPLSAYYPVGATARNCFHYRFPTCPGNS